MERYSGIPSFVNCNTIQLSKNIIPYRGSDVLMSHGLKNRLDLELFYMRVMTSRLFELDIRVEGSRGTYEINEISPAYGGEQINNTLRESSDPLLDSRVVAHFERIANSYERLGRNERIEVARIYSSNRNDNLNLFNDGADEHKLYVIDRLGVGDVVDTIIGK